ncbi:MAG: ATP-binding protein [bacterium]|nr:ATP-binding protein [bacterium]
MSDPALGPDSSLRLSDELPVLTSAAPGGTDAYIPRFVDARMRRALARSGAVELRGPRGVGKTTTALQVARTVFACQNPDTAAAVRGDPRSALLGQRAPVLIDEWQEVPEVLWAVKEHLDTSNVPGRFIITGSVRGHEGEQSPLTGRAEAIDLFPLCVAERRGLATVPLVERLFAGRDIEAADTDLGVNDYIDIALESGYPNTMSESDAAARAARLRNRIDGTVNVNGLVGRHDRSKLADFVAAYAMHSGGVVPLQRLCDDVGISSNTGRAYLGLLSRTYLVADAPSFHHNRISHLRRSPKRLMVDAGLLAAAWGTGAEVIARSADLRGRLLETFVAAQLRAGMLASAVPYKLRHLRRNDREVGFVLDGGIHGAVALEVKAGVYGGRPEARHLFWLREQLGESFTAGAVLHTGRRPPQPLDDAPRGRIWSAPISALWS